MKFREHRGGLAESMATVVELNTAAEFMAHITPMVRRIAPGGGVAVTFKPYVYDDRIGWDTWLVVLEGIGPIGMTDGPPPKDWYPRVEFQFGPAVVEERGGQLP